MNNLGLSPFLDIISHVSEIKITETYLHVANQTAYVTPLLTGDDVSLRSSLTSPAGYDRQIIKLLHTHTKFAEDGGTSVPTYDQFISHLSNMDKLSLIWALYKATYEYLSKDKEFKCINEECDTTFKHSIMMDEIIHDDTFNIWDEYITDEQNNQKLIPFYQFVYPIVVEYDDFVFEFVSILPSIKQNNILLSTLSTTILQQNLEKIGSVLSKAQNMALLLNSIKLSSKSKRFGTVETSNLQEILITCHSKIPHYVSEQFFDKYNEKFNKYIPKFYKIINCPTCNKEIRYDVDLELEFFRRCLLGDKSGF
jgi:hypothetical protein